MILLAGLGNPGEKYQKNRHNVGFMAVDLIAERHGFGPWRSRFQGIVSEGRLGREKCLLLKPETYMNESGRAVSEALRFYKMDLEDVIVFHDELDLKPGKLKVKMGGGHAGNNGLRSIMQHLGADFTRVRIGIGHPGDKNKVANYVLHDFAKSDYDWLDPLLNAISDAAPHLADGDAPRFMNDIALATGADERGDKKKKAKQKTDKQETATKPDQKPQTPTPAPDTSPSTAMAEKLKQLLGQTKKDES